MYHGEEFDIWDIEKRSTCESAWEGYESRGEMSYNRSRNNETYRCCESEEDNEHHLCFFIKEWISHHRCDWERNRYLMNSNSREYAESKGVIHSKPSSYTQPIKKCMDENRDPCDDNDMIVVFMRIFMWMLMMTMIVWVWREDFLEEIDYEKTYNKGINRILTHLESFRKDMDEWDRKHRASTEGNKEVEDFLINFFKEIEHNSNRRNHEKSNDNKERRHRRKIKNYFFEQDLQVPITSNICSSHWNPWAWIQWWGERNSSTESHFLQMRNPWSWLDSPHWQALHFPRAGMWCTSFCSLRKSSTR